MPKFVEGTNGPDKLWGTSGEDVILGYKRDDIIHAGGGDDTVFGGDGWDTLYGEGGNDYLSGGDGSDWILGGSGNDKLKGYAGNDILEGGAGADSLNGGSGEDTASYASSATSVAVSLKDGIGFSGDADGDTLDEIENLTGSNHNDLLGGNDGKNRILGGDGNDTIFAYGGDDWIQGGDGDDYLLGGAGADALWGGEGADTVSYAGSSAAVNVSLVTNQGSGGDAEGDGLFDIENLVGSGFNDILIGNPNDNVLTGGFGTDTLTGDGGADTFVFTEKQTGLARLADRILDFSQADGDLIDVSPIGRTHFSDALTCTFIGTAAFSGQAGELRFEQKGNTTWVSGDVNGDAAADFQIMCTGPIAFTAADFVL